jgi:hypothetical protein
MTALCRVSINQALAPVPVEYRTGVSAYKIVAPLTDERTIIAAAILVLLALALVFALAAR